MNTFSKVARRNIALSLCHLQLLPVAVGALSGACCVHLIQDGVIDETNDCLQVEDTFKSITGGNSCAQQCCQAYQNNNVFPVKRFSYSGMGRVDWTIVIG